MAEAAELLSDRQKVNLRAPGVIHEPVAEHQEHVDNGTALRSVVTGGAGFIGSHLCDALIARGDEVTCVDNLVATGGSTRNVDHLLGSPGFRLVVADLLSWADGAKLDSVDCVFHLAASKHTVSLDDPERDLAVNAHGTLRLLLRTVEGGVPKFVHGSTGSVFGEIRGSHGEDDARNPVSLYGVSKLAGEAYCRAVDRVYGLDYTVLRYYHVVGPRQDDSERGGVVPIFARRSAAGEPLTIFGSGEQTRSFTSVRDVVRATIAAATASGMSRQFFNCASGISVTVRELAEFVVAEAGNGTLIRYAPERPGDVTHVSVDNSKLRALGIEFDTDWRAMVREVLSAARGVPIPAAIC